MNESQVQALASMLNMLAMLARATKADGLLAEAIKDVQTYVKDCKSE